MKGWGAHIADTLLKKEGVWNSLMRRQHINLQELQALWLGLQSFVAYLKRQ
jgi:hypothetical protein